MNKKIKLTMPFDCKHNGKYKIYNNIIPERELYGIQFELCQDIRCMDFVGGIHPKGGLYGTTYKDTAIPSLVNRRGCIHGYHQCYRESCFNKPPHVHAYNCDGESKSKNGMYIIPNSCLL